VSQFAIWINSSASEQIAATAAKIVSQSIQFSGIGTQRIPSAAPTLIFAMFVGTV
jgi:hypothetical protein